MQFTVDCGFNATSEVEKVRPVLLVAMMCGENVWDFEVLLFPCMARIL